MKTWQPQLGVMYEVDLYDGAVSYRADVVAISANDAITKAVEIVLPPGVAIYEARVRRLEDSNGLLTR